jgi:HEAT repeat protein
LLPEDNNAHAVARALGESGTGSSEIARLLIDVIDGCTLEQRTTRPMHPDSVRALGRVGVASPGAVRTLARAITCPDALVRVAATESLGRIGQDAPEVGPILISALHDQSAGVRQAAVNSLRWLRLTLTMSHLP